MKYKFNFVNTLLEVRRLALRGNSNPDHEAWILHKLLPDKILANYLMYK
jgi:hypothetical protein